MFNGKYIVVLILPNNSPPLCETEKIYVKQGWEDMLSANNLAGSFVNDVTFSLTLPCKSESKNIPTHKRSPIQLTFLMIIGGILLPTLDPHFLFMPGKISWL